MKNKIELGQFFTKVNPFTNSVFEDWFNEAMMNSSNTTVLEPFVGDEDIIKMLKTKFQISHQGYDIEPQNDQVIKRDTLKEFPEGYDISVTNPPYLARNSATRKGITWIHNGFDDLYKVSLNKMLENTKYVAAIVPVTLLTSGLFKDRLSDYILLNLRMFDDTDTPVCLALFKPENSSDFRIWELDADMNISFVNTFNGIKDDVDRVLERKNDVSVVFNDIDGDYGVLATDKSYKSIKFVKGSEIPDSKVKSTSRNQVRFSLDKDISIEKLNKRLEEFFAVDGEIFLAPFKNLRKDKKYRRRLDFNTIRRVVQSC